MRLFKRRDDDLVRLATFRHSVGAHSLRLLLEANGIQAVVTGEETNAAFGAVGLSDSGLVGIQVMVKRADYDDSVVIMNEVPAAADVIIPSWQCECGAAVDEGFSICWSCGNAHEEHDAT